MNKKTIAIVIGVIIVVVLFVLFVPLKKSGVEEAVDACLKNGGTYDVTTGLCAPATVTTVTTTTTTTKPVVTQPSTPVAQKPSGPTASSAYYNDSAAVVTSSTTDIRVDSPPTNTSITSPLTITGVAQGSWFFEATFPVVLIDKSGKVLARGTVRAQSDWMTNALVPFIGTLSFSRQPTGSTGALILRKDNPSGIAANDKSVEVKVTFR